MIILRSDFIWSLILKADSIVISLPLLDLDLDMMDEINMSDVEDTDAFDLNDYEDIQKEIVKRKRNPDTSGMFVSGWDDAEEDVNSVEDPKANPVDHTLWAAENGDVDTLKNLLSAQPSLVHSQDSDGYTPLHRAAYGDHTAAIAYLLSVGACVKAKTELGWTPLHSACNWNNYNAVARLLAAGADPNDLSDGGQTPMHLSAAMSHCKSTLLLLLHREDTVETAYRPNNSGETPKQLALGHGIYAPLFEMILPAASYIKTISFTYNAYTRTREENTS